MVEVVLFGREGCCLCDDAREVLERVRARHPFVLRERDIDADPALLRAYLERIPVVTIDGMEAFELFVDEAELERLITHCGGSDGAGRGPGRVGGRQ
jgi:glutaredoxin